MNPSKLPPRVFIMLVLVIIMIIPGCGDTRNNDQYNEHAPAPSPSKMELLTRHEWQIDETFQHLGGKTSHYLRNGENTTGVSQEAIRLKFNEDGSGTNTDVSGNTFYMKWAFTEPEGKHISFFVNGRVTYNWALVSISETELLETTSIGDSVLISARWIPAKGL